MSIAVTSASGSLGSEIVKSLIDHIGKQKVVGLARTPANAMHLGVEIRPGDYNLGKVLESSLQNIDAVLLVSGNEDPEKRIGQHRNVIEAARAAGVRKIVYTSVQGAEEDTAFSPIIQSNRQTEADVKDSGLDWVIGRNGIYIEPDVEYIEHYEEAGGIFNCAGEGKCGYTTRPELAVAYTSMLTNSGHNGHVYNLHGESITQSQLAAYLNAAFGLDLGYTAMTVEAYRKDRIDALGEFLGNIIAGIYEGIQLGKSDNVSHYTEAAGREHQSWPAYFRALKDALPD